MWSRTEMWNLWVERERWKKGRGGGRPRSSCTRPCRRSRPAATGGSELRACETQAAQSACGGAFATPTWPSSLSRRPSSSANGDSRTRGAGWHTVSLSPMLLLRSTLRCGTRCTLNRRWHGAGWGPASPRRCSSLASSNLSGSSWPSSGPTLWSRSLDATCCRSDERDSTNARRQRSATAGENCQRTVHDHHQRQRQRQPSQVPWKCRQEGSTAPPNFEKRASLPRKQRLLLLRTSRSTGWPRSQCSTQAVCPGCSNHLLGKPTTALSATCCAHGTRQATPRWLQEHASHHSQRTP
mmetsp:Transcript_45230/g.106737  ORF Transcript_45230/g.106737 Transcript_45230/m.106737 type:complete len:296 (-) Transcript_45230:587-1474(-)